MILREASVIDVPVIRDIAYRTWPVAYGAILSTAQLHYMLELMYSEEALRDQLVVKGHRFTLAVIEGVAQGFAGFENGYNGSLVTRLHKLYVLPSAQGTGAGKSLMTHVIERAKGHGDAAVELNVNRFNPARVFYERRGFRIIRDEVIDIGNGFVMDDHVMRLDLT